MKIHQGIAMVTALASTVALHAAPFVDGNEAVRSIQGRQIVGVPPTTGVLLAPPCAATNAGCSGGAWKMVETPAGLMECTEFFARPGTCRPSSYGVRQLARVWIAKSKGQWLQCSRPSLSARCVGLKDLPVAEVQ